MKHLVTKTLLTTLFLWIGFSSQAAINPDDVLHPDEAMVPSVQVNGQVLEVTIEVADDVYLYRHALDFIGQDISLDGVAAAIPAGDKKDDPYFGEVQIYRNQLLVSLPFSHVGQNPSLTVKYQGCVDAGICYPPQKKTFDLSAQLSAFVTPPPVNQGGDLLTLGQNNQGFFPGGQSFMTMEQAFKFEAIAGDANTLLARFTMAPNMYLYLDQLQFTSETDGVQVGQPKYSETVEKDDPEFGLVQVFYDLAEIQLPLIHSQENVRSITLRADYQGCEDGKICYPPTEEIITVALPAGAVISEPSTTTVTADVNVASSGGLSEQQKLTQDIGADAKWWTVLKFFGFGLLLALTPCVFPMIPILSSLIVGQNIRSVSKAFLLSLVYVLAMALTYTVVGVVAGVLGANLQAIFQKPWILISFSAVFVLLALSMFGFYDLQLPSQWQNKLSTISNKQKSGSLVGVAVMGLLSALIVGPCVAPPLAAAVIYISTEQNGAVMGGLALFAMSMGMGMPLLLIGATAGKWMPQAGGWMNVVKSFFGIALLGMAIWFMARILPESVVLLLWGLLLVASAIMWHQNAKDNGVSGWLMALFDALKVILLVIGVAQIIGAMAGQKDPLQPLAGIFSGGGSATSQDQMVKFETIKSLDELQNRLANTDKPVYFDFYADWCIECKRMERTTFKDPQIVALSQQFVLLKADVTANDDSDQVLMKHFGVFGPPASLFFDANGAPLTQYNFFGYKDAAALKQTFEKILN
ncbi:MAG: protein-disulfide reductase DsbD [Proteobacteria bacterium]|nr:MAG: protein-disulfide reductase DsbD [Pseudomonadota bacterium]